VKQFQSSVAVVFDSTNPSRSLVAGSLGDLTLKDVVDTLTGGAARSSIDGVLSSIAVRGTGAFSLPGSLAGDLDGLAFEKISGAFAGAGTKIPASSSRLLLVVNRKGAAWHLTDLTTMWHYRLEKAGEPAGSSPVTEQTPVSARSRSRSRRRSTSRRRTPSSARRSTRRRSTSTPPSRSPASTPP
jgi:hypothetical protein